MKTFSVLPLLAVSAENKKNQNGVERGFLGDGTFSSISDYTAACSNQLPSKGGIFEAPNYGKSGEITLDKYSIELRCKHVVQADDSCSEIKITYRDIAVQSDHYSDLFGHDKCNLDFFRFGWGQNELTPPRCNCFGDGCSHEIMGDYFDIVEDKFDRHDEDLGPAEFTIPSNSFTFYFESIAQHKFGPNHELIPFNVEGHVILDWE